MKRRLNLAVIFLLAGALIPALAAPPAISPAPPAGMSLVAPAQGLQIDFGVSQSQILRVLTGLGYTDIRITSRKMTKARAEACKNGIRYDIEVATSGRIRRESSIGKCRQEIGMKRVEEILKRQGFRDIRVHARDDGFVAVGCRRNQRLRVWVNRFGEIRQEKPVGACGRKLSEGEIIDQLRHQGLSRIKLRPARQGRWTGEACRGDRRVELRVAGNGDVIKEKQVGRCDPPIHPAQIASLLARQGYARVEVIDRKLPRYMAHACRGDARVEVSLDRFGDVIDQRAIGRCDPALNAAGLVTRLRAMGYTAVRIIQQTSGGFRADVCQGDAKVRLTLTLFGETIGEQDLGRCEAPRLNEVLSDFESRGLDGATMLIEGCRRGARIRIELDRQGEPITTNVTGSCR